MRLTALPPRRSPASMGMRVLWVWTALLVGQLRSFAVASIHEVHGSSAGGKFTERMFADGHGPFGMGGHSVVTVNATVSPLSDREVSDTITLHRLRDYFHFGIVAVSFTDVDSLADLDEHSVCNRNFTDPEEGNEDGVLYGKFFEVQMEDSLQIETTFRPVNSGLQIVLLVPCWKQKSDSFGYPVSSTEYSVYPMKDPLFCINATISFRNPYGYLPALLYGLFPFSGVLSLLYGFVDICFLVLINRHRREALQMQYMLLAVLLLSTGEAVVWFFTYKILNETGERVCCPYPSMIIFATIVKILAGMVARIATTLVCLGYGIVRPTISAPEVLVVSGLGVCYFISVGALEISQILSQSDGKVDPPAVWEFLVIATNTCFAGWIFTSLTLTRTNLATFGQTVKLRMYTGLSRILYAYVLVSFFLMAMEGAVYSESVMMDWQHIWVIWAANRLLTFMALLMVTVIWRPKSTSQLYSRMDQIPSHEPITPSSASPNTRGIEMMPRVPCALDEDSPRFKVSLRPSRSLLSHVTEDQEGDNMEPEQERGPREPPSHSGTVL